MGKMQTMSHAGRSVEVYRALPAAGVAAPAIVVVQEWWGLNDQIKGICDRIAEAGYQGIAPDLYHGRLAATPDEAGHLMQGLDWGEAAQEIGVVIHHVTGVGVNCGITGFCMGGGLVFVAAALFPQLKAAVPFYGVPPAGVADLSTIRIPLQGHFGEHDSWCSRATVGKLEKELQAGMVLYAFHWYDADHAFMNEQRPEVYDPAAAELAWSRMIEFFRERVR